MRSHTKVIQITQKHILGTFEGFWWWIISDLKIDLITSEPHHVKIFFFSEPQSIVELFDLLTFDSKLINLTNGKEKLP